MTLDERQLELLEFVKEQHGDQKRRYTNEPYWTHPYAVAELVNQFIKEEGAIEIALCHDLIEDTECTYKTLHQKLIELEYKPQILVKIMDGVQDLTDRYTSANFPNFNRTDRKKLENSRLRNNSPLAQSIKYADLIHNTESIIKHDPNFAKTYLKEKKEAIDNMRSGNIDLLVLCCYTLYEAERKLLHEKINQIV